MNTEWAQAVPSFLRAYPEVAVFLAVVQNALKSEMPALGFTVPYAVANIMLAVLAVVMVGLLL